MNQGSGSPFPGSPVPRFAPSLKPPSPRPDVQKRLPSLPGIARVGVVPPAHQPADLDPAARAPLHVDEGRGARASSRPRRARDLRREPSEPHGHAGDHDRAAVAMALSACAGDGEGVLQGAFQPRAAQPWRVVHEQPELLPVLSVLQRVPAASARSRHPADASLHRRSHLATATRCSSSPRASGR